MRYLLVDGHSVIFAWPELRKLHAKRMVLARDELVKILTEYQDSSGVRVVAVFDGKGTKNTEETTPGGIQIFYSSGKLSADSIIERLVAKYAKQHEMTVVTNDHLEQQTTISFGGVAISTDALRDLIEDAAADLARRLKDLRRK
ncbi:NYN domain-containing protein [Verrucomicrobiota bacterium sgz303538]